ncbi:MAG: hypothetical protein EON54_15425 [Alcaligenaceae bacterium]|nr:MAG: hypothetical protein EON54_15425 [Alcaligenaceae bacterium]
MILTLRIDKIEPGNYRAQVFDGREELGEFGAPGIAAAIRQCAAQQMPISPALLLRQVGIFP